MKKKILTLFFLLCVFLPCSAFLAACDKDNSQPPEKSFVGIYVEGELIQGDQIYTTYQPGLEDNFNLSDFIVYASYTDGSIEQLTSDVTMTCEGSFTAQEGGQLNFKYKDTTKTIYVIVYEKDISNEGFVVEGVADSYTLTSTHEYIEPIATLSWGDIVLQKDVDYYLSYGVNNFTNIGEDQGFVEICGMGNYTGLITKYFDINPIESVDDLVFEDQTFEFNGQYQDYTIPYESYMNNESIWAISYSFSINDGETWDADSPLNVGTYKVKASVIMNSGYSQIEDKIITITITPRDINDSYSSYKAETVYTGSPIEITSEIANLQISMYSGTQLLLGTDYEVDTTYNEDGFVNGYKNNINANENAQAKIKGIGNFIGETIVTYEITPLEINSEEITVNGIESSYVFTGSDIKPNVESVYWGSKEFIFDTDYIVYYGDYNYNRYVPEYKNEKGYVSVAFKGNYKGHSIIYFDILPYELDITDLKFAANKTDKALTYNCEERAVGFSTDSLTNWLAKLTERDTINGTNYASLICTPQNTNGILTIDYKYNDGYALPKNIGDYTVTANFTCADSIDWYEEANILRSIKIMKGSQEITEKTVEQEFTIKPFVFTNANTKLNYKENYDSTTPHFVYGTNGGVITPEVELLVDIKGDGKFEDSSKFTEFRPQYYSDGNSNKIYLARETAYEITIRYSDNFQLGESIKLEYFVDKCIITKANFNEYFETPEVIFIKGCNFRDYYSSREDDIYVTPAVPTENFVFYSQHEQVKFELVKTDDDFTGKEVAYLSLKEKYSDNYDFDGYLEFDITYIDPVSAGIYSEIKVNKTENNYETAEDVTDTFFTEYLITDTITIRHNNRLPSGTYIYITLAEGVEVSENTYTKGKYSVRESFYITQETTPENANYRVFKMEVSDEISHSERMLFFTSYNSEEIDNVGSYYEINEIKPNRTDKIIDFDIFPVENPDSNDSIRNYLEDAQGDNYYVLSLSEFEEVPSKLYLTITVAEGTSSIKYIYGEDSKATKTNVTLENGVYTYQIVVDYKYYSNFYIFVDDELELTIKILENHWVNEIFIFTRYWNVAYFTEERYTRFRAVEAGSHYHDTEGCDYQAILFLSGDNNEHITNITIELQNTGLDGYVVLDSEGNEVTSFKEYGVYTIKVWKSDSSDPSIKTYEDSHKIYVQE